jgi:hypothetical protein
VTAASPTDETSAQAVARLVAEGYDGSFYVRAGGMLECAVCHSTFDAAHARIVRMQRFEGNEDPADGEIVVGIECAQCGHKGVLVLGYGPAANPDDQDVLARLDDGRRSTR